MEGYTHNFDGEEFDILSQPHDSFFEEGSNKQEERITVQRSSSKAVETSSSDTNNKSHLFVFTNEKAGMKDVDQKGVAEVVRKCSEGSKFMSNAERCGSELLSFPYN
jgi:hypothetical protein